GKLWKTHARMSGRRNAVAARLATTRTATSSSRPGWRTRTWSASRAPEVTRSAAANITRPRAWWRRDPRRPRMPNVTWRLAATLGTAVANSARALPAWADIQVRRSRYRPTYAR